MCAELPLKLTRIYLGKWRLSVQAYRYAGSAFAEMGWDIKIDSSLKEIRA
jgi:hypothetical protein